MSISICLSQNINKENGTSYTNLLQQAEQHLKKGNKEEAIKNMLKASDILKNKNDRQNLTQVYILIASTYLDMNILENAIEFYLDAIETDAFRNYDEKIEIQKQIAETYYKSGKYDEALVYYNMVAGHYNRSSNYGKLKRIYDHIDQIYRDKSDYRESLSVNKKLLDLANRTSDPFLSFSAYNNIGYDYVQLKDYEDALKSFQKAYSTGFNIISREHLIQTKINEAVCLYNMKQVKKSIETLTTLLKDKNDELSLSDQAQIQNMLATIYLNSDDLYNAFQSSQQAILSAEKANNYSLLQTCYLTHSKILKAGNDHIEALAYYEKYLNIRDSLLIEEKLKEQELSRRKFDIEKYEKDVRLEIADENMLEMKLRQYELERERQRQQFDSLQQSSRLKSLKYETERQSTKLELEVLRKNRAIQESDRLRKDSIIQGQEIQIQQVNEQRRIKEINQLEKEKKQEQVVKRRAVIIAVLLVLVAIIIFSGLLITRKKNVLLASQKKEIELKSNRLELMNEEITTQKMLIEEKNTAITDSIRYAKKIQSAVLPPTDFFSENLKDYFILFRPRDIVSGDFYWGAKKDNMIIIVAADCTGHGVPGAFMSMLGTAFLNEIISDSGKLTSNIILDRLRNKIIEALRQKGERNEARDGMDIALCIINYENNTLQYSGAYNSLYFFANKELQEIKADRMPIGIQENMREHFSINEIKIKQGNCFYIFSDGYTDQFGGPEGKKFKSKPFKDLLGNIHKKPMSTQKEILERNLESWMGTSEQIDDILVIGVRI